MAQEKNINYEEALEKYEQDKKKAYEEYKKKQEEEWNNFKDEDLANAQEQYFRWVGSFIRFVSCHFLLHSLLTGCLAYFCLFTHHTYLSFSFVNVINQSSIQNK